nr:type II toxin-antitoxin system PemK/MazF family toxin [Rickettsia asiatica]
MIPLTTNVNKCYPWEVYVIINGKQNKAITDQITTASKLRLKSKISVITNNEMQSLEYALKLQLELGLYL